MKALKYLTVSLIIIITVSCEQTHRITPNDWPQYKNDNYRSGRSEIAIFDETFGKKWVYKAAQVPAPAWYGPAKEDAYALSGPLASMRDYDLAYNPIIVDSKVYYSSSSDDALHSLDAQTGKENWVFITDGPIRIAPTFYNGKLYFGSDDGFVYCVDALTGDPVWKFSPSSSKKKLLNTGRLISFWPVRTGVLIEDGIAYFGASLIPWKISYLCAVDAENGKTGRPGTYVKELENVTFEGSMASSGERLIQPQGRVSPVFINRLSGEIEGRLPGTGGCFVLVTPDKHIIHPQTSRYISIEDTAPDEKEAQYMSFKGGKEMVVAGNIGYVLSDHAISAYDRTTKEALWVNKSYHAHRIILADTVLFAGATDTVYAVSVTSGRPLWTGKVEGTVYAMAVGDSALFVSTGEGKIYCFARGFAKKGSVEKKAGRTLQDAVSGKRLPLELASGPYIDYIDQYQILLTFRTDRAEKCSIYWRSNGNFEQSFYREDSPKTVHAFKIPVRKDFIYKYRISAGGKSSDDFEYDNFFNFSPKIIELPQALFKDNSIAEFTDGVIEKSGKEKGLCLLLGFSGEQLPLELARKSALDVIVLDKSSKKISNFRNKLVKQGIYGRRISAYAVEDLSNLLLQSDLADLIICNADNIDVDEVIRLTAPFGMAFYLKGNSKDKVLRSFEEKRNSSDFDWQVDEKIIALNNQYWLTLTKNEPQNSGVWTHQYGKPDNSSFGGESMWGSTSSDEFEIQWMGRPGPRFQTDRNGRKPSPLAINGKLFVQGKERVAALNAYNGTVLWSKVIPGMMRMNVNHDCSNWAADDKWVFIIVKNRLLVINQQNGEIIRELTVPEKNINRYDWGYVGALDSLLILSQSPKNSSYTDYYGGYGWYDATKGPATDKVMSSGIYVYKADGSKLQWKYENGTARIINATITVYNNKIFFVESHSALPLSAEKRGGERIFKRTYLVSLNLKDGSVNWRRGLNNIPGITVYYMAAGGRRLVIVSSNNGKYYVYNYQNEDGALSWQTSFNWPSNNHGAHLSIPAIAGNRLMVKPALFNLQTGERLDYDVPKAGHGCASYALSEQSVFYRGGSITQFNFDTRKFSKWERLRPDCWISTVPALCMVLSPEGGGGCSCGNWFETSMVMAPKSRAPLMFKFDGDSKFVDSLRVNFVLKNGINGELYYTADGSQPDKNSTPCNNPLIINKNTELKAVLYYQKEGRERKIIKSLYFERLRPAPRIKPQKSLKGGKRAVLLLKKGVTGEIHYTTDGSHADEDSPVYEKEILLEGKSTVKALTIWKNENGETFKSEEISEEVDVPELVAAVHKNVRPGLLAEYYEGKWKTLPDFDSLKVRRKEVVSSISLMPDKSFNDYALRFSGYINVPEDGFYTFYSKSDDGSAVYINDIKVVDNDGIHNPREKSGVIALQEGLHPIRVEFFQGKEGQLLTVMWDTPLSGKGRITEDALFH